MEWRHGRRHDIYVHIMPSINVSSPLSKPDSIFFHIFGFFSAGGDTTAIQRRIGAYTAKHTNMLVYNLLYVKKCTHTPPSVEPSG